MAFGNESLLAGELLCASRGAPKVAILGAELVEFGRDAGESGAKRFGDLRALGRTVRAEGERRPRATSSATTHSSNEMLEPSIRS